MSILSKLSGLLGGAKNLGNKTLPGASGKTLRGTMAKRAVQYKALDTAGKFIRDKAQSHLSAAIKPFFDKNKLPGYSKLKGIGSLAKKLKKRAPGAHYLEVSEKDQKNKLRSLLASTKKIPFVDLGQRAKEEIDREQKDIVDVSSVSPEVQKNFDIIGRQIGYISKALVTTDKRIVRFERSLTKRLGKVSELHISNQTKVKKYVDSKIDTIHDFSRGFDDKLVEHDTQIDAMRGDLNSLKMQMGIGGKKKTEKKSSAFSSLGEGKDRDGLGIGGMLGLGAAGLGGAMLARKLTQGTSAL